MSHLESFSWLRKNHPDAHATILKSNDGDMFAASVNWRELQEQIQKREFDSGVMVERVRCMDLLQVGHERGAPMSAVRATIIAGTPGVQLPEFASLPVNASEGAGRSLAQSIISNALGGAK